MLRVWFQISSQTRTDTPPSPVLDDLFFSTVSRLRRNSDSDRCGSKSVEECALFTLRSDTWLNSSRRPQTGPEKSFWSIIGRRQKGALGQRQFDMVEEERKCLFRPKRRGGDDHMDKVSEGIKDCFQVRTKRFREDHNLTRGYQRGLRTKRWHKLSALWEEGGGRGWCWPTLRAGRSLDSSGLQGMPLGDGRAGMTHHVFPVLHFCGATLPWKVNLPRRDTCNTSDIREIDGICKDRSASKGNAAGCWSQWGQHRCHANRSPAQIAPQTLNHNYKKGTFWQLLLDRNPWCVCVTVNTISFVVQPCWGYLWLCYNRKPVITDVQGVGR